MALGKYAKSAGGVLEHTLKTTRTRSVSICKTTRTRSASLCKETLASVDKSKQKKKRKKSVKKARANLAKRRARTGLLQTPLFDVSYQVDKSSLLDHAHADAEVVQELMPADILDSLSNPSVLTRKKSRRLNSYHARVASPTPTLDPEQPGDYTMHKRFRDHRSAVAWIEKHTRNETVYNTTITECSMTMLNRKLAQQSGLGPVYKDERPPRKGSVRIGEGRFLGSGLGCGPISPRLATSSTG